MTAEQSLKDNFDAFGFPIEASKWLLDLWCVIQVFDDVADDDEIPREMLDRAIWASLVAMPANPFFRQFSDVLVPVVGNAVLKWKASDTVERMGLKEQFSKAYMWRAAFYDVVLQVYAIVHGDIKAMQDAHKVMMLYGETYKQYVKELQHA